MSAELWSTCNSCRSESLNTCIDPWRSWHMTFVLNVTESSAGISSIGQLCSFFFVLEHGKKNMRISICSVWNVLMVFFFKGYREARLEEGPSLLDSRARVCPRAFGKSASTKHRHEDKTTRRRFLSDVRKIIWKMVLPKLGCSISSVAMKLRSVG